MFSPVYSEKFNILIYMINKLQKYKYVIFVKFLEPDGEMYIRDVLNGKSHLLEREI